MRQRDFALQISDDCSVPLFRRVAEALEQAIRSGRLKPGEGLPGTRVFAEGLDINRRTVSAALEELEAQGWLVTEPCRGTFVANPLPEPVLPSGQGGHSGTQSLLPGFDLPSRLSPISRLDPEALVLSDGFPDSRLFPSDELGRAYQRALLRHSDELLQNDDPLGNRLLRSTLAEWVANRRGLTVPAEQILITRGSGSALSLLCHALLKEGDSVGVEDPGGRPAWETILRSARVRLIPIPVDGEGLVVDALEEILRNTRLRFLYLTPQRQFPTTVTLSPKRRVRLLELAAQHRVAILEDDFDADYHFGEAHIPPLASLGPAQVVYMSSLSRLIAPTLRMGFIAAPQGLVERLARLLRTMDSQGDRVLEWAVADLIRDDELTRLLRRARRVYQTRRDFLDAELHRSFDGELDWTVPTGGLALWLGARGDLSMEDLVTAARRRGLVLNPPSHFVLNTPCSSTRIGFGQAEEPVLAEAVKRLSRAIADIGHRQ